MCFVFVCSCMSGCMSWTKISNTQEAFFKEGRKKRGVRTKRKKAKETRKTSPDPNA